MKILLLQEAGRHQANAHFREALSYQRAFTKLGHEAIVAGLNHPGIPMEEYFPGADVIFLLEQYDQTGWVPDFSDCKALRVFLSVDSHCNAQEHIRQCERQRIQLLLCATERYLDYYHGMKKLWWPNAYDDELVYPMPAIPKTAPMGFCGNVVSRGPWLEALAQSIPGFKQDIFVIGEDMVKAVNSYETAFNRNIDLDINYRTFEVPGCRVPLFTNYTPNLEKLFDIGKEIITYSSLEDLVKKFRELREEPERLAQIAEAGYQRVKRDHTYLVRARQFLEVVNGL